MLGRKTYRLKLSHCETFFAVFDIGNCRSNLIRFCKIDERLIRFLNFFKITKYLSRNERIAFNAFTLAEVLITLGIIGVVAAITIPSLMQKYQEYQLRQALKKNYSVLSQAILQMQADNNGDIWDDSSPPTMGWFIGPNSLRMRDEFGQYIKFIKTGGVNEIFTNNYAVYKAPTIQYGVDNYYAGVAKDGALMAFMSSQECKANATSHLAGVGILTNMCGEINVDVNGSQKPNMWGYDMFNFWVIKKDSGEYAVAAGGTPTVDGLPCQPHAWTVLSTLGCTYPALK